MAQLSGAELRRFAMGGYLVLPHVVDEALLAAADREIDHVVTEVAPQEGDGGPGPNLWFLPRSRLPGCDGVLRTSGALNIAEQSSNLGRSTTRSTTSRWRRPSRRIPRTGRSPHRRPRPW